MSRAWRVVLAYDGTAYSGWQIQPGRPTVQGLVVTAAQALLGDGIRVTGASRTDAGVHALRQAVSIRAGREVPADVVKRALNATLPRDIRVVACAEADERFDARRAALGKRYGYLIENGSTPSPFLLRYAWSVPLRLDVERMRCALEPLRGRHDFSAFCAAPGREHEPTCTVRALHVLRRRDRIAVLVSGDRFLHHMVRNIVGSAVEVGRGAREPGWLADVLASRDRRRAGPTAPAHGLTLLRVMY
ncbi:MAG TPA: tRNA pseudouridine(38-40) synthase TruA [Candidatus Acidoferrum sp.]|nr:tRNA pseudouridine(38-40) synthase TruA [Candidatus Acidoferrum sp.]